MSYDDNYSRATISDYQKLAKFKIMTNDPNYQRLMDLLVQKRRSGKPTPRVWLRFTDAHKASMNIHFGKENGDYKIVFRIFCKGCIQ